MNFNERIETVLLDRKLYPWASAMGVSNTAANRIKQGVIPGSEILTSISKTENVNLTWLVGGKGAPYIVERYGSDSDLAKWLTLHIEDGAWEDVYIYTDGQYIVIELSTPASFSYKNKMVKYTAREVMAGPLGDEVLDLLWSSFSEQSLWICYLEPETLRDIHQGKIGPFQIHGDSKRPSLVTFEFITDRDSVFKQLQNMKPVAAHGEVSVPLLHAVMKMVRQLQRDEGEDLNPEDELKVVAAAYKHAIKKNLAPADLDPDVIQGMFDVL